MFREDRSLESLLQIGDYLFEGGVCVYVCVFVGGGGVDSENGGADFRYRELKIHVITTSEIYQRTRFWKNVAS